MAWVAEVGRESIARLESEGAWEVAYRAPELNTLLGIRMDPSS